MWNGVLPQGWDSDLTNLGKLTGRQRSLLSCPDLWVHTCLASRKQLWGCRYAKAVMWVHTGIREAIVGMMSGAHGICIKRARKSGQQAWAGPFWSPRVCAMHYWMSHVFTVPTQHAGRARKSQTQHTGTRKRNPLPPAMSLQRPLLTKNSIILTAKRNA